MHTRIKKMTPRSPVEAHRVSTSLELFFDLVFVVAISFAGSGLHQSLTEQQGRHGILHFVPVFFAIWVAWLNFSWFASAYDIDDALYRIMVLIQMTGALVLAAGIPRAFDEQDFRICIAGYVIMRSALVSQWLRAAHSDPEHRRTAIRYAAGTAAVQVGWVIFGFVLDSFSWPLFIMLGIFDTTVPIWAERAGATTWHPHHIVDRYGGFTIIVLGEAVLATSLAVQSVVSSRTFDGERAVTAAGAILTLYMMWWIYFDFDAPNILTNLRNDFIWGYGHVAIWAAIAAVGAGIGVCLDYATGHTDLSRTYAQLTLAIPIAIYLVSLWAFHDFTETLNAPHRLLLPCAAILIVMLAWTPYAPIWIALALVGVVYGRTRHPQDVQVSSP